RIRTAGVAVRQRAADHDYGSKRRRPGSHPADPCNLVFHPDLRDSRACKATAVSAIVSSVRATGAKSISRVPISPEFDPRDFLEKAGVGRTLVELKKNQVLFSQGDAADAVFYIEKGNIKLSVVSERGKEATVALLESGNFVGESCVAAAERVRMVTATAIT